MNNEDKERKMAYGMIAISSVPLIIMTLISFLIGVFALILFSVGTIHSITYVETTGEIVDIQKEGEYYGPVYEFEYKGKKVTAEGPHFYEENELTVGQKDTISYNPNNYKQFDIGKKSFNIIGLLVGLFFLTLSITVFIRYIKVIKKRIRQDKESSNW